MSTPQADRAAIRARLTQAQSQYGAAHAMTWRDLYEYGAEPYRDLPTDLAALLADVERLTKIAADCYRMSGADPDGDEDWRLANYAVQAVENLRSDEEAAQARADALAQQVETLRAALRAIAEANPYTVALAGQSFRDIARAALGAQA